MADDPSGHVGRYTSPVDTLYGILNFLRNPSGLLSVASLYLTQQSIKGEKIEWPQIIGILLLVITCLALTNLIFTYLGRTYQLLFAWLSCALISALLTGWCLSNKEDCIFYYMGTKSMANKIVDILGETMVNLFNGLQKLSKETK